MRPVEKAIWYIESHFASDITLDDIASVAGVSKFYMTRAFGEATGRSVMLYVRGRRLSEAAKALAADGAAGILPVALDAGYGSHEAFTRAFRDQFGLNAGSDTRDRHQWQHRTRVRSQIPLMSHTSPLFSLTKAKPSKQRTYPLS